MSLRRFAEAVAKLAIERNGLDDPVITHALRKLDELNEALSRESGVLRYVDDGAIDNLKSRARVLDAGASAIRRAVEDGKRDASAEPVNRWRCARAVSALRAAFDSDPYLAAADAAWEALHALDDVTIIETLGARLIEPRVR
jgi:hypothetical protein